MKTCNVCKKELERINFFRSRISPDGLDYTCKECRKLKVYARRQANKSEYNAYMRKYNNEQIPSYVRYLAEIKRRYGCSKEQYEFMLASQNNACYICLAAHNPDKHKGRLYVDHCHDSGKIRGLLCGGCNSMLGYAKDNTQVLQKAIEYLNKHKG